MKNIVTLLFILFSINTFAQEVSFENLCSTWYLDKYSDAEQYYNPPKKEIEDYFTLNEDMTYTLVSEREMSKGTWMFNKNGKYLEFKSEEGKEKMYIHFVSEKSLVVTYDTDEHRIWEVHYVSCKK